MFCRQQAAALMGIHDRLTEAGVTLIAVGSGSPGQAREFAEKFSFKGEIYVDRDLGSFKAFRLERGITKTLGPSSLIQGVKALGQGFRQGLSAGDLWQQGGVFVIGPGNRMLFEHRDRFAGDHADPKDVLAACLEQGQ
jgi:hypothetical protein